MISIIGATDDDLLIGKKDSSNGMPWHNKEDLQHFKKTTLHQTILMGKTTYMAIGRPLPHRKTIVVTRGELDDERVEVRHDLVETIQEYKNKKEDLFICGGASIYKQALPYVDELIISRIPGKHEGETYFPNFDEYNFQLEKETQMETFVLQIYKIVKKARVDLECYGLENLPQENGYLITPNHQGLFDIVAVFKTHDKTAKFVLKKELASTILIKDVVKTLDYYALDRSNIRDGAKMVKNVSKEIEAGMNYVIYPEGTRSKQGNKIGEFKGGTFKIALKSHCPIVPVAMIDCYQVFDNNTIKPVKAQIHYLKPIEYDEYKDLIFNPWKDGGCEPQYKHVAN